MSTGIILNLLKHKENIHYICFQHIPKSCNKCFKYTLKNCLCLVVKKYKSQKKKLSICTPQISQYSNPASFTPAPIYMRT